MKYAKIIVKNNYRRRGDLVLRSYIRALEKIKADSLLNEGEAYIYGRVDGEGVFHELFTGKDIGFNRFVYVSKEELLQIARMDKDQISRIRQIIKGVLFKENTEIDFEISNPSELAEDRKVEFEAYNGFLSRINPYARLSNNSLNDYDNFLKKIEALKDMAKYDDIEPDFDAYDINSYYEEKETFSGFQKRIGK